jgi:hypothetical protein
MNIVFNNNAAALADPLFLADENTAKAMLESTFFNNITLTFNVGLGINPGTGRIVGGSGAGGPNRNTEVELTYGELRTALLNNGQPNFFNATNLPAGASINNITNFWVSSSQAKALGLPLQNPDLVDGSFGISANTRTLPAGPDRVATILHEIGHAMGRFDGARNRFVGGVPLYYPELGIFQFRSPGSRTFLAPGGGYFSLNGGAMPGLVNWDFGEPDAIPPRDATPSDFEDPANFLNFSPTRFLDPYNASVVTRNSLGQLTALDIQVMDALGFSSPINNAAPPAGTSSFMVLRGTVAPNDGTYVIYDLGNNAVLGGGTLGGLPAASQFVALGRFNDGDTSDILLRAPTPDGTVQVYQVYDVVGNSIQRTAVIGRVGSNFQPLAFGNFGVIAGNSDMILRDTTPAAAGGRGAMFIYNISNNLITGSAAIGAVGLDWNFSGVGNFSSAVAGEADLLLRNTDPNSNTPGQFQVYDIANNTLIPAPTPGGTARVGLNWTFSGIGNFSSNPGESDLLLRDTDPASPTAGQLRLYDIVNNTITPVQDPLTTIDLQWQFAGVAPIRTATSSDLVLRNVNTGAFQVWNIGNNRLLSGTAVTLNVPVDNNWRVGGLAPGFNPATPLLGSSSQPTAMDGSTAQTGTSTFQLADANGAAGSPVDPPSFSSAMANPAPPDATTANMVLRNASNPAATYQIYNLGANSTLAGSSALGQVGSEWGFVAIGNFNLDDPSDMLLRNSTSGAFQAYEIVDNNIISSNSMGAVGMSWQVMGFGIFGPFSGSGETDMMLRDANTGNIQAYDIFDNEIVDSAPLGAIGLEWQFSGIGNFGSSGNSDLLVRNSNTGELVVHNIGINEFTGSESLGTIGLAWQFSGVGNFSSNPDESDLLLRNSNTGELLLYNISNNEITGPESLGTIGLEWQFAGVAPVHNAISSDLVLRNVNTGAFQVYNIANNHLTGSAPLGAVGTAWQLGGFSAIGFSAPPVEDAPPETAQDASTAQLVQAMAGFGGGGAAISNTAPLGTEASQQPLLTTPQHA